MEALGKSYKSWAVDSAICPLNSSCDNKHNAVSVRRDRVCGEYFYEVNVGRVWRFGAAVLVHMLYTVQFCAKQSLSKIYVFYFQPRTFLHSSFSQHFFFVALTDGFHSLTGLPFTSVIFTEIPLIAKGHLHSVWTFLSAVQTLQQTKQSFLPLTLLQQLAFVRAQPHENSLLYICFTQSCEVALET